MTFLPIVMRELRVAARRRSTYFFRFAAAVLGLVVLLWIMLTMGRQYPPEVLGIGLFRGLTTVAFCYALLIGIFTTADSVSEEKRDGTLGFLFLTDLKGYDIVLGKLAATSMNAIYGLIALFPIMAIPLLTGGVSGAELWRVVLSVTNGIFLSLALGMAISSLSKDERAAMVITFVLLLFIVGGLPLIGALLSDRMHDPQIGKPFFVCSPAFTSIMAFEANSGASMARVVSPFYTSLVVTHLMAWFFLAIACVAISRVWQDKTSKAAGNPIADVVHSWRFGSPESRLRLRRLWLARNPFAWLAGRDQLKAITVWGFMAVLGILWLWGWSVFKRDWTHEYIYIATGLILHTLLKCWVANEACRQIGQDGRSGALELLLSTPLSVKKILDGQLMALLRQFAGPALVILLVDYLFLRTHHREREWLLTWMAGMIVFVADMVALAWVGMWMGLRSRSLHRASAAAIVRILVLPWMMYFVSITAMILIFELDRGLAREFQGFFLKIGEDRIAIFWWMGLALATDLVFALWARSHLLQNFRAVATGEYGSKKMTRVQ